MQSVTCGRARCTRIKCGCCTSEYLLLVKKILYIHGFASAGSSGTATQMRSHFYPLGVAVVSPDVPLNPVEAMQFLRDTVAAELPDLIVSTSMGALYGEQLRGIPRLLVNPSFHMARLLTFRGMGRQEFRNKRADGARDFKVDRAMIQQFQQVEKNSFAGITPADKAQVYGLFGTQDKNVNCQPDFLKHYGRENFVLFDGEHYLNGQVLSRVVIPLAQQLLRI